MKRLKSKLKSKSGETFTEVLVSMMVISLASLLLASMIMASQRIVSNSAKAYTRYVNQVNLLETHGSQPSDDSKKAELGYTEVTSGMSIQINGKIGTEDFKDKSISSIKVYQISEGGKVVLRSYGK